jgi:hypothetical protein
MKLFCLALFRVTDSDEPVSFLNCNNIYVFKNFYSPAEGINDKIMEQHALKIVNSCLNTNIYSYLETSGGKSLNPYLSVVHFFSTRVNLTSVAA